MIKRRRFYLSEEGLNYLDSLANEIGVSGSVLLDTLLLNMKEKESRELEQNNQ